MARLVVFSDLHGNTPALESFLGVVDELHADVVVNLGDIASGGVDPRGTLDLLASRTDFVTIRGNHERQLLTRTTHVTGGSDWLAASVMTEGGPGAWTVTLRALDYGWERAARLAEASQRLDVAVALRTGRVA